VSESLMPQVSALGVQGSCGPGTSDDNEIFSSFVTFTEATYLKHEW